MSGFCPRAAFHSLPSVPPAVKKALLLFLPALAIGLFAGYRSLHREAPVEVAVQAVDLGMVEATVSNTRAGSVKARHRANLTPAIGGQIAVLNVRKADQVKAGQVLLSLWNKDLTAELELARSQVIVAEANWRETCRMADLARRQATRQTDLRATRATSESKYDEAVATAVSRQAACEAAEAQKAVGAARVEAAAASLERTILVAPFDGIVAEVNGEVGEYLTPSPPGIPTLPAVDLISMDSLYVAAPIDEIDAAQIRPNMEARITLDAFPKRVFAGRVRSISPYVLEVAKQARTVEIEVEFDGGTAGLNLLAGYSADVEVILDRRAGVPRLPTAALLNDSTAYILVKEGGRVARRPITAGLSNWKFTEVVSGARAGEQVVISIDRQGLKDGALVRVEAEGGPSGEK